MRMNDRQYLVMPFCGSRKDGCLARGPGSSGQPEGNTSPEAGDAAEGYLTASSNPSIGAGSQGLPFPLAGAELARPNQVWAAISPASPRLAGTSIWRPLSSGPAGTCFPGDCPTPWTPVSAVNPWKRRSTRAGRTSSTPSREPVHQRGVHRAPGSTRSQGQHRRAGELQRQPVDRRTGGGRQSMRRSI